MSVTSNFTCYSRLCLLLALLPCYQGRRGTASGAERAVAAAVIGVREGYCEKAGMGFDRGGEL